MGKPEEIAAAVVWLCSDAAAFVIGHAMVFDGKGRLWVADRGNVVMLTDLETINKPLL